MEESTQTPTEETPVSDTPSKDSTNMAMLCHLLGIFTCFIGPLILWLIKKDEDKFVAYHGKEALNFQITMAIALFSLIVMNFILSIVLFFISFLILPLFLLLFLALGVTALIFVIKGILSATKGQYYKYPFALRLIK